MINNMAENLIEYCESGNIEEIKKYLDIGFDINSELDELGSKALDIAYSRDNFELMKFLVDNGAILEMTRFVNLLDSIHDEIDQLTENIGYFYVESADIKKTNELIKLGANINEIDVFLETPLDATMIDKTIIHKPAYDLLKSLGAKTLEEHIQDGFDVNSEFKDGKNRLEFAILKGYGAYQVSKLIKLGCKTSNNFDINIPIEDGKNLLEMAITNEILNLDYILHLLELGCQISNNFDINKPIKDGKNLLENALTNIQFFNISYIEILIKLGAKTSDNFDINATIEGGKNLLELISRYCRPSVVDYLRELGAKTQDEIKSEHN
ncbi:MAG: hypothetical protein AABZ74_14050 [Cyanobacteriota bacterium]